MNPPRKREAGIDSCNSRKRNRSRRRTTWPRRAADSNKHCINFELISTSSRYHHVSWTNIIIWPDLYLSLLISASVINKINIHCRINNHKELYRIIQQSLMNRINFHNRSQIFNEYTAKKGHNRCIYCDQEYHSQYNKHQNTFMWAGCDYHLAHRQCILQRYGRYGRAVQITSISCELCSQVFSFDQSNVRAMRVAQQKEAQKLEEEYDEYEEVHKQVEKTGVYKLK